MPRFWKVVAVASVRQLFFGFGLVELEQAHGNLCLRRSSTAPGQVHHAFGATTLPFSLCA
jgi:hypothetical protein